MPKRKRKHATFSLSFLDIMACGFGAIVLLFMIIDHASDVLFEFLDRSATGGGGLCERGVTRRVDFEDRSHQWNLPVRGDRIEAELSDFFQIGIVRFD